jgi:hypothetical protein
MYYLPILLVPSTKDFLSKNGVDAITQTNVYLFISSQHVSAQIGHHQASLEEIHKW